MPKKSPAERVGKVVEKYAVREVSKATGVSQRDVRTVVNAVKDSLGGTGGSRRKKGR